MGKSIHTLLLFFKLSLLSLYIFYHTIEIYHKRYDGIHISKLFLTVDQMNGNYTYYSFLYYFLNSLWKNLN